MTAKTSDFSGLLYYNPAGPGFDPVASATIFYPHTEGSPFFSDVDEGQAGVFNVVTWAIPDSTLYWRVYSKSPGLTDGRFVATNGSFSLVANRGSFTVTVTADNTTVASGSTQVYSVIISKTPTGPSIIPINFFGPPGIEVNDTSQTPVPTPTAWWNGIYLVPLNEGDTQTIDIAYSDWDGSTIYWEVYGGTSSSADFDTTSGTFTGLTGSGTAKIHFTAIADSTTEGTETYYVRVGTTVGGNEIAGANSGPYQIGDTSVSASPTYTLTPAASSINEGSSLTFTVGGTNITDGTYYWTINNTTTSNADFSVVSGSFSITSNSGSFTVAPTADTTTEGSETFTVSIRSVSTSGTILATSSSVTINDTSQTPAGVPTGSIVGRWNAPGAGQFGGDPIIWPEASGYSWAKFYHLATYSLGGNGTIGYSSDGSSSYIQTPIHMTPGDFTLAFTARLNPTGTFPQGIFDCSQSGAYAGLRAYWTDATHIVITSPGTGTGAIDMTGSGWHTYGPSFFTIRMKLDNIANTGSIDIFVNGTAWANVGAPRGANGFPATDAGTNMILGALVDDLGTKVGFLESTWFNFIYYSRALSNSEVTQLYTAQQAGLFNPTPATTYSFVSNFTAGQASSNIYISIGFGGMGPTVPPDQMGGWYVSGPGISDVATVTSITNIVNDSQFYVTIDQSIFMSPGTYTFTNGPAP